MMQKMHERMKTNVDIGELEETVSFRLAHEPIPGMLRRLTTTFTAASDDHIGTNVNATIHMTTIPANEIPPEVERVDVNDANAALRVGVLSDAEPNDLKLMDCSLSTSTCVVNGTVPNPNATSLHRRLDNRRLCGSWVAATVARVVCSIGCNWAIDKVYEFICKPVQKFLCDSSKIQGKQLCYDVVSWAVCGKDFKSPDDGKQAIRDRVVKAGGISSYERNDIVAALERLPIRDQFIRVREQSIKLCTEICTVVMVVIWTFIQSCFPASAQVMTPTGLMAMSQISPGVSVLTPTGFKPIYFMGDADQRTNSYIVLRTASGHQLTLSGDHFIYADGEYRFAKNVQLGHEVPISNATSSFTSVVTSINISFKQGAYNPYVEGGQIIINGEVASYEGVVASCHSSVGLFEGIIPDRYLPSIYETLFKPILMIYHAKPKAIKAFHAMYVDKGSISEHPITKIIQDAVCALLV